MVQRGYLLRAPDPTTAGARACGSAPRAGVCASARRRSRRAIEAELRAEVGDRAVDGLRRALLAFIEREGALDEVKALRSRVVV